MSFSRRSRFVTATAVALAAATVLASCSRAGDDQGGGQAPREADQGAAAEVRLGYFPNVTHAPAIIGVENGLFAEELGSTKLTTQTFNAGPDEVNALLGGSLDVAFIGSGPAINAFTKSEGTIQLISGAVSGGAQLVVKPGITSPEQLKGATIATPQLGNTQDVALKKWLSEQNLSGEVTVANMKNPQIYDAFRSGEVDGGWLPEPWPSQLVEQAGAHVLLDEKDLWPGGKFPTTVMIARSEFVQQHPETVKALLRAAIAATEWAGNNAGEAKAVVNSAIEKLTGDTLSGPVLDRAFDGIELSPDPASSTYPQLAEDSVTAGVVDSAAELSGFLDLSLLNEVLAEQGKPEVDAAGLQAN
ncbi:ABC transporter substrate-binding protein [Saccharomonospora sp. NPDC006951]